MGFWQKGLTVLALLLCFALALDPAISLSLGFVFRNSLGAVIENQLAKVRHFLLQIVIVCLGFSIDLNQVFAVGSEGLWLTSLSVLVVVLGGVLLAFRLGLKGKLPQLITYGTAICGGSAIAAVSPLVGATPKDTSSALGVVFLLNALAVFIFPAVGAALNMSNHQFGLWCAVAIHDTSSVIGAAGVFGDEALELATTAKVMRALWILPLILYYSLRKGRNGWGSPPLFIVLFVAALTLASFCSIPPHLKTFTLGTTKSLMSAVLFLMGGSLSLNMLKSLGAKPLVYGVLLWVFIGLASALVIQIMF
ncbi:YeiH family protein [Roseivirga thermotolerans]|uniref:Membrane protein n=1 Tax=Roseivirga thermotolerans TaxID=1758176 RepID=A0ABQ3IEQ5_9BACT|nr:putative sulfate exporter family transporter [Roseivirga thermotolerans]GHE74856.1 membrane protein [Roseivirga thermotolerans]